MKFFSKKNKSGEQGFTIIEVIVSLAIFTTVMTVAAGSILSIVDANRKSQAVKNVVDNLNFALDDMVRNIRVGTGYSTNLTNTLLSFTSQKGIPTIYRYSLATKSLNVISSPNPQQQLTSSQVVIDDMHFFVTGTAPGPSDGQPQVFISLKGHAGFGDKLKYRSDFFLQTSVTQRQLDL